MNILNLTKLAADLDMLHHAKAPANFIFDMRTILSTGKEHPEYEKEHPCATVGCMAGWILFKYFNQPPDAHGPTDCASEWLGLTLREAGDLFFDSTAMQCSAAECAVVVRHLIETGHVDWDILPQSWDDEERE